MSLLDSLEIYQEYIVSPSGKKYTNEKNVPRVLAMTFIFLSETGYTGTGTKNGTIEHFLKDNKTGKMIKIDPTS